MDDFSAKTAMNEKEEVVKKHRQKNGRHSFEMIVNEN